MAIVTRHSLLTVLVLALVAALATGLFIWFGLYNIGADDSHTRPVHAVLETLRERSIEARSRKLHPPPDLSDPARIRSGAGNYDSMCTGCHLAPGMAGTELSKGLNPAPPNLSKDPVDAAEAFWVIKHGIKASGMPAWGMSMQDEYIWGMVAFLQELPRLNAAQYRAMVASSGGHSHGGGETRPHGVGKAVADEHGNMPMPDVPMGAAKMDEAAPHAHAPGTPADHHATTQSAPSTPDAAPGMIEHRHADGTVESHPAPTPTPAPPKADDGHDHAH